ncbi:MAG: ABC transporter ATP-binding protein [Acidobacteriota bacterium]
MLRLAALESGYAEQVVVRSASVDVGAGAFVCIVGRNGAGKSTLMRTISGMQPSVGGDSLLEGRSVSAMSAHERAQAIAVVTTERVSSPGLLASDVVALGRQPYTKWHGQLTEGDREAVREAMRKSRSLQFSARPFNSLSDGERQRVMIARALAQSAKLMVLDELTAFLDLPGRVEMMALLRRHAEKTGKTVLLSSHDLELSLELAGEIWIVHEGQLVHGAPETLIRDGSVQRVFDNEDVSYDPSQRRFTLVRNSKGQVASS